MEALYILSITDRTDRGGSMRKVYQSIWVELPYSVVQILDIKMNSGMNCHANLQIVAICEDEERTKFINQPVEYKQDMWRVKKSRFLSVVSWKQVLSMKTGRWL